MAIVVSPSRAVPQRVQIQCLVRHGIGEDRVRLDVHALLTFVLVWRHRVAAVEKAEAQKIQVVKAAEADAEAKFLAGQGIARQRQAIVNGLRESVLNFSNDVNDISSRDVIEMVRDVRIAWPSEQYANHD